MKKLVQVQEVSGEGLMALLGQKVTVFCMNYIYAGELEGVNEKCILLKNAHIVYETGSFDSKGYKDAQKIADQWYVATAAIESYGVLTNK